MNNKNHYKYVFENGEIHHMTPVDAHRYSHRKKIRILKGPNYNGGKQVKTFDGFGWHDGLNMAFRGPKHYRSYLKEHGLEEWGNEKPPVYSEESPPIWDDVLIKKVVDSGIEVGSVLAKALKEGTVNFPE